MSKPSWVSEETPKVGNESLGGIIAFGVTLALAAVIAKGVGWLFKKIEEGVKKLKEKHAKHVEATTGVNGYVLELKKNDAHLKERLSGFHKPFSALSKDQILTMLKGLVNKQYHDALSHLSDSVLKTPEAIVSIALMCHHSIDPVYLKHIISNSLFTKDPILLGFMANSGYKSYTTLSWHDGLYRKSGTKLSQSAITVAARLVTIYKEVNSLVDGPYVSDEMRKYLKTHKKEIEALYEKAEDIWADVSNLYYDKKYVIDIPEKDYDMVDVLNKDALTLGRIFCDLGTMEHVLKTQEVAGKKFDDSSRFIFNLDYANSSLQTDNFDLEKGIKEDVNTWEMLEKLLGTMYGMIQTLGHVGFEYEYAASEILDSSQHTLACYKAMDKIMNQMKGSMPSVALESWFSSKPKHSVIEDAQKHIDERLKKLVAYVKENHVIENYHKTQKLVANVKMSPEQAKAFVLKHIEEDYEKEVEKLPASVFSSAAVAYGIKIVTVSPCQEDYESDYVCLKRILKSSAFNSQPILTAIASQTGMLSSELSYLLDNGVKLGQFLDKATELAKAKNKTALASHYEAFCQDLEFEHWGYCFRDSSPIEDHNGLKLVTALTASVPIQTMDHLFEKMKELIAADVGSNDKAVVGFAHVILSIFNNAMSLYRTCNEFTNECLRDLEKVGTEGFGDFYSETMNVNDFAIQYDLEHQLDTPYRMVKVDANGNISEHKVLLENGTGAIMEQTDLGVGDLLDMESDTENFDFVLDNERLGIDELEDFVSNDEETKPEVVAGLEHYGELIQSKGMCKEYYAACESLQPGIFAEINQNRLTALPSRTMQVVALEAVEGEQKKGLIARLIEKIKQFFKWVLSKLGLTSVKGKDASGKEVEVEYDSDVAKEIRAELWHELQKKQDEVSREANANARFQPHPTDKLRQSSPSQRCAADILKRHYHKDDIEDVVKRINTSNAWNQFPFEVAGILTIGPCVTVKDDWSVLESIGSLKAHLEMVIKLSEMISNGTLDSWNFKELDRLPKIEGTDLLSRVNDCVKTYNFDNLEEFPGMILSGRNTAKVEDTIKYYLNVTKQLNDKLTHAKEVIEKAKLTRLGETDLMSSTIFAWLNNTMKLAKSVNIVIGKYTRALVNQERWARRYIKVLRHGPMRTLKPATESFGWSQPAADLPNWCTPAMEAIDFQYKSKLFTRLTQWCAKLRMDKVFTSKALMDSDLGKIIEEETNLQFIYKIDPVADPNAAVLTVQLDRNNPIYANFLHRYIDNDELLRAKSLLGNTIEGLIDYQKAKVGGVFAKVKNTMWLTVGLVQSKMLTDEEVAAVICHEIGHTFTIFSQIASLVSLNYIVDDLSKRLLGTSDKKVQINILHEYDSKYGIKLPEEELLATVDNKQKFVTKVVTDVVKNSRNSEGDYVFSLRNCEMAADQFAARMGAGRAIVTGLNKMYAAWGQDQYHSKTIHYMIQAFQIMLKSTMIAAGLFIAPMFSVIFVFAMVVARPQEKVYDDPMERFTRVRNEYIVALKRLDISREMKQVYLDDIKSMDNVISALNKNVGWLEWVWDNWIPSGKRTKAAMDYQQLIERMGNNDLFMKSASYELLIEDLKNA